MSEKQEARRASIVAFASRHSAILNYSVSYTGDFPYRELAETVRLPETADIKEHKFCWQELYRSFDQAWYAYARRNAA